jgi:hypothetical protein
MASIVESTSFGGYITENKNLNFSSAKQKYTFGKEGRFPSVSKKSTNAMCYNLPDTLKKRSAGFGIGQRFKTPMEQRKCKSNLLLSLF